MLSMLLMAVASSSWWMLPYFSLSLLCFCPLSSWPSWFLFHVMGFVMLSVEVFGEICGEGKTSEFPTVGVRRPGCAQPMET